MKPGRNDPCHCGSGKKYKNCCLGKAELEQSLSALPLTGISHLEALFSSGRHADLESSARLLLEQNPEDGVVWKLFGLSLQMQGKESLLALQKAAELLPHDAEAHANLAGVLRALGRLDDAVASGRRAVQIKPDFAEAHNNLGVILKDLGQLGEAVTSYRRAIRIKPDFAEAYNNLGVILKDLGQLDEAAASYRRAIKIEPDFVKAYCNLGVVLYDLGQFDGSQASYYRALEIDPAYYEAVLGIGSLCMENGEMAEAEDMFRKALKIKPDGIDARYMLSQVKKVKADDENLAALSTAENAMRNGSPMLPDNMIQLNFALGKSFDDIGDYDRAFPHFMEGGKLKRSTLAYDAEQAAQFFADIMRVFDRATIDRLRGAGNASQLPVFILGMPRSGTTLTEQIIASHPEVYGAGELTDLLTIAQRDVSGREVPFPDNILALKQTDIAQWAGDYVARLQRHAPGARRITDKMPKNFLAVGLIHIMLPNAKIIHVNRSPVDTCLSCFVQLFRVKQEHTYDLAELGRYYVGYARLMEHWRSVLPAGAFLDVQYEAIVADQEKQARRMIDFCGLDWSDACIDFHKSKRSVRTASVMQVRRPIYKSALERWRPYEKFLNPLLDALGDLAPKRS